MGSRSVLREQETSLNYSTKSYDFSYPLPPFSRHRADTALKAPVESFSQPKSSRRTAPISPHALLMLEAREVLAKEYGILEESHQANFIGGAYTMYHSLYEGIRELPLPELNIKMFLTVLR